MKTKRIIAITAITLTLSGTFLVAPSYGLQLDKNFQRIITLISQLKQAWGEQGQDAESSASNSVGDMSEPDPVAASETLKQKTADAESLPTAQEKGEALSRAIARLKISQALGKDGQAQTKAIIDENDEIAQQAQVLADEAQNMDASQNILKVIAAQNAQIVSMLSNGRSDSLQQQYDTVHSNMLLTQVADNLATQRQQKNTEQEGLLSLLHEVALNARLDPASANQ
ncbi:hypothetical protein H6G76_25775 [Nostoc sp. FACHB-152]|uniref:hypothetical protein n=1 Tax=Nostoc sp. FACHB-152 TaxID=2692837 RepID=UPI001682A612|nr:hypothetical protein [Nostoc sp. FACHB-152]MBD2450500.1 hypothetical protein [Nostoc sp. FACHB-152]